MDTLLVLVAVAVGLAALFAWWVRRANLAVAPAAPWARRELPVGCELGSRLLMASQTTQGGETGAGKPGGTGAPKRQRSTGPSRRSFLRTSWLVSMLGAVGAGSFASIGFLWPNLSGGFGAQIDVDDEETILQFIRDNREPFPYPAGRLYLVEYDESLDSDGSYAEVTNGARVMALYQKCVHLGCKVPWCLSAQWFQCPCHGSNYNRWGEWQSGPAARGLDRFPLQVNEGRVIVDTATIITGPSREAAVLQQQKEGPDCI